MVKEQQTERMNIRLAPSEVVMLQELSEVTGQTMTNVIRQAIRRVYSEQFGRALPKPKPKR